MHRRVARRGPRSITFGGGHIDHGDRSWRGTRRRIGRGGRVGIPLPLGIRTGGGGGARRRPTAAHDGRRDGGDGGHGGPVRGRSAGRAAAPVVVQRQRGSKASQVVVYAEEEDEEDEGEDGWGCVGRRSEKAGRGRPGPGPGWCFFLPPSQTRLRHDVHANLGVEELA